MKASHDLLKEYKDFFIWTYVGMPGLDRQLITNQLNIKLKILNIKQGTKLVMEVSSIFKPKLEVQTKQKFKNCWLLAFYQAYRRLDLAN